MNELLSRLLAGDLPPAEAAALRARIAAEPELATRWAEMQSLVRELEALPEELPPPPALARPKPRRRVPWTLLLAAAAMLFALVPRPGPTLQLARGTETVDGRLEVLAGDTVVDVDGKVAVTVEPPAGLPRETATEALTMDRSHFLAALAGSAVTVVVLEGTARVHHGDGPAVHLVAGQTHGVGHAAAATPEAPPRTAASPSGDPAKELAALKLEHAITVGQLRALGGQPQTWPANLPEAFRPGPFERFVRERAAGIPDAQVVTMDCDEYPCIAIVRSNSTANDWQDGLMPLHHDLASTPFGDDVQVIGYGTQHDDGTHDVRLYAFSVVPGENEPADGELRSRLDVRVRGDLQGATEELIAEDDAAPVPE